MLCNTKADITSHKDMWVRLGKAKLKLTTFQVSSQENETQREHRQHLACFSS